MQSLLSLVDNGELEDDDGDDGEGVEEEVFIIFEKDIWSGFCIDLIVDCIVFLLIFVLKDDIFVLFNHWATYIFELNRLIFHRRK